MKANKNYPWIVVGLLWVVALLNYMDRQMLSTMQGAIKADIEELNTAEVFGALMAVFMWVYGCFSPFAGVIADKLSRKWLVVGSLFVWSAVTLSMGFATNFETLYVLRALMGVSEALYIPSALALITDWHTGKSRSLAIGVHMTGLYVGQGLGGFGANLAHHFSWHQTFFSLGLIGVLYSLLLMFLLHENPECSVKSRNTVAPGEKRESIWRGLSVVLSNWAFGVILFYFAVPSLPGWATKNWLPTLFLRKPIARHDGSRPNVYHHHLRFVVHRRYFRWNTLGQMGSTQRSWPYLHQCHRTKSHHSLVAVAGFWPQRGGCSWRRTALRHWFWYFRCQQHAHPLPVCVGQIPRNSLWHHEHDGRFCWCSRYTSVGFVERRRQSWLRFRPSWRHRGLGSYSTTHVLATANR